MMLVDIAGVSYPVHYEPGHMYGKLGRPGHQVSALGIADNIQRNRNLDTFGTSSAAGVVGRKRNTLANRVRGSTPDFLSGFTPLAFGSPEPPTRQIQFIE